MPQRYDVVGILAKAVGKPRATSASGHEDLITRNLKSRHW
jgi:hypothetical protein